MSSRSSVRAAGRWDRRSTATVHRSRCGCSPPAAQPSSEAGSCAERLDRAIRFRESLAIDATAYRLVHGEGDLLPSLVVDRYGDYLVVQTLSQATERLLPEIVAALQAAGCRPAGILVRNDAQGPRARRAWSREVGVVAGAVPDRVPVREGPRPLRGRSLAAARRPGSSSTSARTARRRCATRTAGCSTLQLRRRLRAGARAGAAPSVVALEISADASARIHANAERNGIRGLDVRTVNVFDELHELDRARRPASTPSSSTRRPSRRTRRRCPRRSTGYKEINRRALRLLAPGGFLVTCTCSHHVDDVLFEDVVRAAAADAGVAVSIVEKRTQGRDHPVLLGVPETLYLKCLILRRL